MKYAFYGVRPEFLSRVFWEYLKPSAVMDPGHPSLVLVAEGIVPDLIEFDQIPKSLRVGSSAVGVIFVGDPREYFIHPDAWIIVKKNNPILIRENVKISGLSIPRLVEFN